MAAFLNMPSYGIGALRLSSRPSAFRRQSRDPYVDGPRLARGEAACGSDRLRSYVRSVDAVTHDRCQYGFRDASSKHVRGVEPPLGPAECLASWDRSITPSAPSRASSGLQLAARSAAMLNWVFASDQ